MLSENFLTMTEEEAMAEFNERILGMMADYKFPMSEALWHDFEGVTYLNTTDLYLEGGMELVEKHFRKYLSNNKIKESGNVNFFTDVIMGRTEDFVLRKDNE